MEPRERAAYHKAGHQIAALKGRREDPLIDVLVRYGGFAAEALRVDDESCIPLLMSVETDFQEARKTILDHFVTADESRSSTGRVEDYIVSFWLMTKQRLGIHWAAVVRLAKQRMN